MGKLFKHDTYKEDAVAKAFRAMIKASELKEYREKIFENVKKRIRVITLRKDTVMPTAGVQYAFGNNLAPALLSEWDFPFPYSHQHPFPLSGAADPALVNQAFQRLFSVVSSFLK